MTKLTLISATSALMLAIATPLMAQTVPPPAVAGTAVEGQWRAASQDEMQLRSKLAAQIDKLAVIRTDTSKASATGQQAHDRAADAPRAYVRLLERPVHGDDAAAADRWAERVAEAADDWHLQSRKTDDWAKKEAKSQKREASQRDDIRKTEARLERAVSNRRALERQAAGLAQLARK